MRGVAARRPAWHECARALWVQSPLAPLRSSHTPSHLPRAPSVTMAAPVVMMMPATQTEKYCGPISWVRPKQQ